MGPLLALVSFLLLLVQIVLVVRVVLDWSGVLAGPASYGSFRARLTDGVHRVTEPILAPVRRVLPPLRVGAVSIDLAFIVVFFLIVVIRALIG